MTACILATHPLAGHLLQATLTPFRGCDCAACTWTRAHVRKWIVGCDCAACGPVAAANARMLAAHEMSRCRYCGREWWSVAGYKDACPQHQWQVLTMRVWADCTPVFSDTEARP